MIDRLSSYSPAIRPITEQGSSKPSSEGAGVGQSFTDLLSKAVGNVNADQVGADQSIATYLSGRQDNLHETMIQLEKADVSLRLLVNVRNKAVDAYREIMRMQI